MDQTITAQDRVRSERNKSIAEASMRACAVWVALLSFSGCASNTSNYEETETDSQSVRAESLTVGEAWTDDYIAKKYRLGPYPWIPDMIERLWPGLVTSFRTIVFFIDAENVGERARREVYQYCTSQYSHAWPRVRCIGQVLQAIVYKQHEGRTYKDIRFPIATICRDIAKAFTQTAGRLNGVSVDIIGFNGTEEGHVLNRLSVLSKSGSVLSYAFDAGFDPSVIHPISAETVALHDRNCDKVVDDAEPPIFREDVAAATALPILKQTYDRSLLGGCSP